MMEQKDKYYVPSIEEFCVGFEYEIYEDFDMLPTKIWHSVIWEKGNLNPESMFYPFPIKGGKIRVRCLSAQDIIDCEFELDKTLEDGLGGSIRNYKGILNEEELTIETHEHPDFLIIKRKISFDSIICFSGKIKNKSELKRLLKQITE